MSKTIDKELKSIQSELSSLIMLIEEFDDNNDDTYLIERKIQEFNADYDKIDDKYSKIKERLEEEPENEKPLLHKIKSIEDDMNKCKRKILEKKNKLDQIKLKSQYYNDELEGADKMKAERAILLENQKKVDTQGLMINSIQENVRSAGTNLKNINNELGSQGEKMDRIHEKVIETEDKVKHTSHILNSMERRNVCMKILAWFAIIVLGLLDIAWIIYLIVKRI